MFTEALFLLGLLLCGFVLLVYERRPPTKFIPRTDIEFDVIIVGAGVSGCTLAVALARQGRTVLLIERSLKEPNRIVGELMQPAGVHLLRKLGMEHTISDIDAQEIPGYTIFHQDQRVDLPYPPEAGCGASAFKHGKFIQKLRECAINEPNVQVLEGLVTKLDWEEVIEGQPSRVLGVHWRDHNRQLHHSTAHLSLVCDGCMSTLRKSCSDASAKQIRSRFAGIEVQRHDHPEWERAVLVLSKPTPILCYPISSKISRVLVDVPNSKHISVHLQEMAKSLPSYLRPSYEAAISQANSTFSMPNQSLTAIPSLTPGLAMLGDALSMRHPLTGSGMTIALRDVVLLSELLSNVSTFSDTNKVTSKVDAFYNKRTSQDLTMNVLADALYEVVSGKLLCEAFFSFVDAFSGALSKGPMRLLSGISTSNTLLLLHFASVAIYGGVREFLIQPGLKSLGRSVEMAREAIRIIAPVLYRHQASTAVQGVVAVASTIFGVKHSHPE